MNIEDTERVLGSNNEEFKKAARHQSNEDEKKIPDNNPPSLEFNFPFPPYDIQLKLMKEAYETFESSKFALLESPTGTGKSMSLICSSLTWLRNHQKNVRRNLESKKDELLNKIEDLRKEEEVTGDWLTVQSRRRDLSKALTDIEKELNRIIKFELKSQARRHAKLHGIPLSNYHSLITGPVNSSKKLLTFEEIRKEVETNFIGSQESQVSEMNEDDEDIEKRIVVESDDYVKPKIFYASRTHSQLSQFINEVKRTKFANIDEVPPIKVAPLASRANLCVNSDVLKLRDSSAINERCMELQKETKAENRCPYIKLKQITQLKDDILSSVQDIEDLVDRGRAIGACPYYATKMAIPEAELVVLPYNNLLHRETRLASSLDLKESIVIVDEAHNVLETICSIHSAPISGLQLVGAHTIFSRYYQRCHSRMSPKNSDMIKTIVQCLKALICYLSEPRKHLKDYDSPTLMDINNEENLKKSYDNKAMTKNKEGRLCKVVNKHEELMVDITKFIGASGVERFNVFKILDFFNRSQLARKLLGFFRQDSTIDLSIELHGLVSSIDKTLNPIEKESSSPIKKKRRINGKTNRGETAPDLSGVDEKYLTGLNFLKKCHPSILERNIEVQSYPVYTLIEFLRSLTNLADDGKIHTDYYEHDVFKSSLKFILLNPSSQFRQMTQEARSVVLAGGTMQPFDEFTNLLFGPLNIDESRLKLFSCGHVISPNQLFVASLATGLTGKQLELSYRVRSSLETIDEIGRTIMSIALTTPGGMVCFMPSYDYEHLCFNRWCQIGLISKIETRSKHVFREPKKTTNLKIIWDEYCKRIEQGKTNGRGALLFCVVGGKMSEGINFNDDLGRCIVMVGLPYASIKSCELQQKMGYYDKMCKKLSGERQVSAGQQYYENLCLKGINQSIGRAIRHRHDYAAIILIDRRYSSKNIIKTGLPNWMNKSLKDYSSFNDMLLQLGAFFDNVEKNKLHQ